MVNIYKINKFLIIFLIISIALTPLSGLSAKGKIKIDEDEVPVIIDFSEDKKVSQGKKFPKRLLSPDKLEDEYTEDALRRFDVIFFLSLPFVVGYQIMIHQMIASNATIYGQSSGSISNQQLLYIGLSSLLIASGIAYEDYRIVSSYQEKDSLSVLNPQKKNFMIGLSWNFSF